MAETIERIGICDSKAGSGPTLFHRLKIKLSRKYRVWPVPGDDRYTDLDPSEFVDRYREVQSFKPA
jgi:hypothetical protein